MKQLIYSINNASINYLILDNISQNVNKKIFKTMNRNITITKDLLNYEALVYNGNRYIKFIIIENMVGQKLGEFAPTKKIPHFPTSTNKIKSKK